MARPARSSPTSTAWKRETSPKVPSEGKKKAGVPSGSFRGTVYRHVPQGADATSAAFSRGGGRWNPPGEFEALYTSLSETGIRAEFERAAIKRGISTSDLLPRDLVALSVALKKVADLTDSAVLKVLGAAADDLVGESFQSTQELARVIYRAGFEGALVPSATGGRWSLEPR